MNIIEVGFDVKTDNLFCPYCGKKIISGEFNSSHCEHTAYIASEEDGLQYINNDYFLESVNENLGIGKEKTINIKDFNAFTDQITPDHPSYMKFSLVNDSNQYLYVLFIPKAENILLC